MKKDPNLASNTSKNIGFIQNKYFYYRPYNVNITYKRYILIFIHTYYYFVNVSQIIGSKKDNKFWFMNIMKREKTTNTTSNKDMQDLQMQTQ